MTTIARNRILMVLAGLLVVVVAVQSFVIVKLNRQDKTMPAGAAESFQMNLQPQAGTGQAPPGSTPNWNPPFGGLGLDPGIWDPFKEFRSMRQQMEQMFNDSFGRFRQSPDFPSMWGGTAFAPRMDVEEQDEAFVIRMDIPGAEKSDISVDINDRRLTVSGEIEETVEQQEGNHLRKERRSGRFERSIQLPGSVDADGMEAEYEKGVLVVTVPKTEKDTPSRRIEVQ